MSARAPVRYGARVRAIACCCRCGVRCDDFVSYPNASVLSRRGVFFVILGYKTATTITTDRRTRLLLLDAGAAAGLLPLPITLTWTAVEHTAFRSWPALVSTAALDRRQFSRYAGAM